MVLFHSTWQARDHWALLLNEMAYFLLSIREQAARCDPHREETESSQMRNEASLQGFSQLAASKSH